MITLCDDVLYHVFEQLSPSSLSGMEQILATQALARVAVACKRFTEPALATLWKTLLKGDDTMIRLLLALDIVVAQYRRSRLGTLLLIGYKLNTGRMRDEDVRTHSNWSRFQQYTTRVRRAKLDVANLLHLPLWQELQLSLGSTSLLPLLDSAEVFISFPTVPTGSVHDRTLFNFIPPTIHHLTVRAALSALFTHKAIRTLVRDVCVSARHIRTLTITCPGAMVDLDLKALVMNRDLRSVTVHSSLPSARFRELASLSNLKRLSLETSPELPCGPVVFDNLSSLEIRARSYYCTWPVESEEARQLHAMLTRIRAPHLLSLTLHVHGITEATCMGAVKKIFAAVASEHPTVEVLHVDIQASKHGSHRPGEPTSSGGVYANFKLLVSLLKDLRGLREFCLDCQLLRPTHVADTLRTMHQDFPCLEELDLQFDSSRSAIPYASVDVLILLARDNPRLRILRLPLLSYIPTSGDASTVPPADRPLAPEHPQVRHRLQELVVTALSAAPCAREVVTRLAASVFPCARRSVTIVGYGGTA